MTHPRFAAAVCRVLLSSIFWIPSAAFGAEMSARWRRTRTLSSPHAHQAAAATEKYVFAVSSTRVAKYDRKSGRLLGLSTGDARHLNSGFFWRGKLFCAHSNFPRTPERSEIKVLDVESMKLTDHKNFGDYGGSLTWAVRHDGHWWCNFAKYGEANADTFLVKFDDRWRERGRWTYPRQVLRHLAAFSLSGGLWHEGRLLVTDHDHGRVYRLRIPKAGTVLEFIDIQSAPFTGQGIATDPVTGGLLGIDRSKKLIVFAEQKSK